MLGQYARVRILEDEYYVFAVACYEEEKYLEKLFFCVKMFDLFFSVCYHCNNYYKNKLTHACAIEKTNDKKGCKYGIDNHKNANSEDDACGKRAGLW